MIDLPTGFGMYWLIAIFMSLWIASVVFVAFIMAGRWRLASTKAARRPWAVYYFALLSLTIPCIWIHPVGGGVIPFAQILLMTLVIGSLNIPYLVLYGPLFGAASALLAWLTTLIQTDRLRIGLVCIVTATCLFVTFQPVYSLSHGGGDQGQSLWSLLAR